MTDDYRSKGERIAYLSAEIERLTGLYEQHGHLKESMDVCVKALNDRIKDIRKGEV